MKLSDAQQRAYDALAHGDGSVLLSGVAGCGKSTVINRWRAEHPTAHTIVLAPTGIAALNVGGSTIHRAFGFHPRTDMRRPGCSVRVRSLLARVDTIVIDEISMVRADLFGAMDAVCREAKRKPDVPFGGIRVIMVGDFWQLPPVVRGDEEARMLRDYGSRQGWVFQSPAFAALAPEVHFLTESFRQAGDGDFAAILNAVRNGDPACLERVNSDVCGREAWDVDTAPWLCARKAQAAEYNGAGLAAVPAQVWSFGPVAYGDTSKLPRELAAPLHLAEGCRVMLTRNGCGYVNGSVGTLDAFDATAIDRRGETVEALGVRLDDGSHVTVPRETAEVIGYEAHGDEIEPVVLASVSQYPVALGYAWTIHKSQGQTLDRAGIDLGAGAFAHGQTYVALSRVKTLEGVHLASPLQRGDLIVDPDVVAFFGGAS